MTLPSCTKGPVWESEEGRALSGFRLGLALVRLSHFAHKDQGLQGQHAEVPLVDRPPRVRRGLLGSLPSTYEPRRVRPEVKDATSSVSREAVLRHELICALIDVQEDTRLVLNEPGQ
jgi:hypothetical protein